MNETQRIFVPGEITQREHCFDRVEPFIKHRGGPVLKPERPWEGNCVAHPTVIYDREAGIMKMWYECIGPPVGSLGVTEQGKVVDNWQVQDKHWYLCYAISEDGLTWDRPALNRIHAEYYPDNNITHIDAGFIGGSGTVMLDRNDPDTDRRYKLLIYDNDGKGGDGARSFVSPDGTEWKPLGPFPVLPSQDAMSCWYDERRKRYVALLKTRLDNLRSRMISVSDDFENWTDPEVMFDAASTDRPTEQFYDQCAFHHCGHDWSLLGKFNLSMQTTDIELTTASLGVAWRRLPTRPAMVRAGDPGAWDCGGVYAPTSGPFEFNGRMHFYYTGTNIRHDSGGFDGLAPRERLQGIGVATFTPGRMVGQQFAGNGWFESMPFRCPGGKLLIDANLQFPLTVEVRNVGYGGPFDGYRETDCIAVNGNSQEHTLTWKDRSNLDALAGRYVQLRVYGKNSIVYGFRAR
jgi:hypothetical protein